MSRSTGQHPGFRRKNRSSQKIHFSKVDGVTVVTERHWNDQRHDIWRYRYAMRVPLRADTQPLYVNWREVTIMDTGTGELIHHNAWATNPALTALMMPLGLDPRPTCDSHRQASASIWN
jgi:hypothetical protein